MPALFDYLFVLIELATHLSLVYRQVYICYLKIYLKKYELTSAESASCGTYELLMEVK